MAQSFSSIVVCLNNEKQVVSVPVDALTIILRNEACKVFGIQNPSDYYLEHNGKYLDLITSLSFYVISTNDCIELKVLDQACYSKKARIGIQYEDNNSSRQYIVTTKLQKIVSDALAFSEITIPSNMQPCLMYFRIPLTGSDFEYQLIDLGWYDKSIIFHLTFVPSSTKATLPLLSSQQSEPSTLPSQQQEFVYSSNLLTQMYETSPETRLNKIHEELFLMQQKLDSTQFTTAVSLLIKIVQNIINEPDNETKRSINYTSAAFQKRIGSIESGIEILSLTGFELISLDEMTSRLVMKRQQVDLDFLSSLLQLLQSQQITDETPAVSSSSSFNPTKPIIIKSVAYPSVIENMEKQVSELKEEQMKYETQIPERNVCIFRAENGFNPRNFGESTYENMMKHHDDETPLNETPSISTMNEEVSDETLIKEVMQRKQKQREDNLQFKTKAKRELESLQKQRMYKRTTIRVYFPDHTVLQAYFAPRETIEDVMKVIQDAFQSEYKDYKFYLFNAPPKEILKPTTVLRAAKMVPAAMVYLGWEDKQPGVSYQQYLKSEVLQNTPMVVQVDRGLLVNDIEEKKKEKKKNMFSKLVKKLKI